MLKILKSFKKQEIINIILAFSILLIGIWADLRLPEYMSEITKLIQTEGSVMSSILLAGVKMLACAFTSLITTIIVGLFVAKIAAGIALNLRKNVYEQTIDFSKSNIDKFSPSSLITRTTNDITQISMFISLGLTAFLRAPITAIWAITKIANKNITFTFITIIAVILLLTFIGTIIGFSMKKSKKIQILTDKVTSVIREMLIGIRVVRAYNAEEYQNNKFKKNKL